MAVELRRSVVPRVAVENTIRKGIELHEKMHGPVTPEVRSKITRYVIRQARILNEKAKIKDDEIMDREGEVILYGPNGRRIQK